MPVPWPYEETWSTPGTEPAEACLKGAPDVDGSRRIRRNRCLISDDESRCDAI